MTISTVEDKVIVTGANEVPLHSFEDTCQFLENAKSQRSVGRTDANEHSSRSHCIFRFELYSKNLITNTHTRSKLFLIDLAG